MTADDRLRLLFENFLRDSGLWDNDMYMQTMYTSTSIEKNTDPRNYEAKCKFWENLILSCAAKRVFGQSILLFDPQDIPEICIWKGIKCKSLLTYIVRIS